MKLEFCLSHKKIKKLLEKNSKDLLTSTLVHMGHGRLKNQRKNLKQNMVKYIWVLSMNYFIKIGFNFFIMQALLYIYMQEICKFHWESILNLLTFVFYQCGYKRQRRNGEQFQSIYKAMALQMGKRYMKVKDADCQIQAR